jgi:hypothetical protein
VYLAQVRVVVFGLILVAASTSAAAKRKKKPGPYGPSSRVERPAEARGEASLRLRSIDFARRAVVVEVGGFPRPPAGNLFTFSDDRGRKFVAVSASCDSPFPSGVRVCDLITPEGYERHPWVGLQLHLHGLASASVSAPPAEVERAYEAARALAAEPDGTKAKQDKAPAAPTPTSPSPGQPEAGDAEDGAGGEE